MRDLLRRTTRQDLAPDMPWAYGLTISYDNLLVVYSGISG
jgi:hypothetical protein